MRITALIITLLIILVAISSCWTNPDTPHSVNDVSRISEAELIELNEKVTNRELAIIDSLAEAWDWSYIDAIGGMKVESLYREKLAMNPANGDTIALNVSVSLINGQICFSNKLMNFIIGHSNEPIAFEELAKMSVEGDSLRAIVPSFMGYGLRGVPGVVPPCAMLVVNLRRL